MSLIANNFYFLGLKIIQSFLDQLYPFVLFSYALYDMDGNQVPQELVTKIGETFESILKEVLFSLLSFPTQNVSQSNVEC